MSNRIHKIFAVAMAFMVLLSTTGVSMTIHVCLGKTVAMDMVEDQGQCDDTGQDLRDLDEVRNICGSAQGDCDQGCCEKRTFTWQTDNDFIFYQAGELTDSNQKDYTVIQISNILPQGSASVYPNFHQPNAPPPLVENKRILYQSFLL
jgi:hypothetical protein